MNFSFRTKIIGFVFFACALCTVSSVYVSQNIISHDLHDEAVGKSRAILSRLESARKFVANQGVFEATVQDVVAKYPAGDFGADLKERILNTVPIYASLKVGAYEADKDNYVFRVAANDPRRKENQADAKEKEFLAKFESDEDLKELVYDDEQGKAIWVMRPIRLSANDGCLKCHGDPATSPYKNGKDVLGYPMENWKDGYLHGMFVIKSSTEPITAQVAEARNDIIYWSFGLMMLAIGIVILLLKKPIQALNNVVTRLGQSAENCRTTSANLGEATQTVSASNTEQAAAIQETMASMAEMSSMVSKTLELAKQTSELSTELDTKSAEGTEVMQGMVSSMESIKSSNEELKKMVQIINDISTKTNVINDIVFKTQLLSVNASIEAARAGQHGKGFAVVAEEVGNLALISGKAAEEIRDMLANSQKHVQQVVEVTNTRVTEGERVSHDAMKSFFEISDGIKKIQGYSQSVNDATTQQQEGINQISTAIAQMDQAAQANSRAAGDVSQLSQNMVEQGEELASLSVETEVIVNGAVHTGHDHARTAGDRPRGTKSTVGGGLSQKIKARKKTLLTQNEDLTADSDDFTKVA